MKLTKPTHTKTKSHNLQGPHKKNFFAIAIAGFISIALGLVYVAAHAAGSASLSLTPASGSNLTGSNFTVTVKQNGSDQVNTVNAVLNYDASKLQFVSIDTSVSTFDYPLSATGGNGTVTIARGVSNGGTVTGPQNVANVTFKALAGSGSSAITFGGSSAIVRPNDGANVWNGSTTGGTYSFTTPAPPPPTVPPTTPPTVTNNPGTTNTPTPSAGATKTPTPGSPNSNTTTNPGTSTSNNSNSSSNANSQNTNPEAPVEVGKSTETGTGYLVAIKCTDKNGKLLVDAVVTLDAQSVKTDATGIASFANVTPGKHTVALEANGTKITSDINVADGGSISEVQSFDVGMQDNSWMLWVGLGALALLIVGGVIIFIRKRRDGGMTNPPAASVTTGSTNTLHSKDEPAKPAATTPLTTAHPSITLPKETAPKPVPESKTDAKSDLPKSNVPDIAPPK